jgi:hypothetical protein
MEELIMNLIPEEYRSYSHVVKYAERISKMPLRELAEEAVKKAAPDLHDRGYGSSYSFMQYIQGQIAIKLLFYRIDAIKNTLDNFEQEFIKWRTSN